MQQIREAEYSCDWCRVLLVQRCQVWLESEVYLEKRWVWPNHYGRRLGQSARENVLLSVCQGTKGDRGAAGIKGGTVSVRKRRTRTPNVSITARWQLVLCRHFRERLVSQASLEKMWVISVHCLLSGFRRGVLCACVRVYQPNLFLSCDYSKAASSSTFQGENNPMLPADIQHLSASFVQMI